MHGLLCGLAGVLVGGWVACVPHFLLAERMPFIARMMMVAFACAGARENWWMWRIGGWGMVGGCGLEWVGGDGWLGVDWWVDGRVVSHAVPVSIPVQE